VKDWGIEVLRQWWKRVRVGRAVPQPSWNRKVSLTDVIVGFGKWEGIPPRFDHI
jgi:hypothetical protein